MIPNPLFSNQEYYHNKVFKRMWLEYEKISSEHYHETMRSFFNDPDELIEQMFENFYLKLYRESLLWLNTVGRGNEWRWGLE